jgi:hypothetical protein
MNVPREASSGAGFTVIFAVAIEYVEAVLSWPVVIGGALVFIFWRYHNNIAGLLDRVRAVRWRTGEALLEPRIQEPPDDEGVDDDDLLGPIVAEYEEQIAEADQTVEDLQRDLAFTEIMLEFERIYRIVYGSQLAALRELKGALPAGLPRSGLEHHHRAARAKWGDAVLPADPAVWLSFLQAAGLAELRPDGGYYLTQKGDTFLNYINSRGYPDQPF